MSDDEGDERHLSSRYDRLAVHTDPPGGAQRPPDRYRGPGHTEVSMGMASRCCRGWIPSTGIMKSTLVM